LQSSITLRFNSSPRGSHSLQGHLRGASDEAPASGPLHYLRGWLPKFGGRALTAIGIAIVGRSGNRGGLRGHRHSFPQHTHNRRRRCGIVDVSRVSADIHGIDDTDLRRALQHRCRLATAKSTATNSAGSAAHVYAGKFKVAMMVILSIRCDGYYSSFVIRLIYF